MQTSFFVMQFNVVPLVDVDFMWKTFVFIYNDLCLCSGKEKEKVSLVMKKKTQENMLCDNKEEQFTIKTLILFENKTYVLFSQLSLKVAISFSLFVCQYRRFHSFSDVVQSFSWNGQKSNSG